jgi:hypothetical protein
MKRILRKRILLIIGVVIVFFVFLIFTINQEQVLTKDLVSRTQKEKIDTTPPITAIALPYDQSWQNSSFFVTIEDVENDSGLKDFIQGKQGCEYLIEDVGTGFSQQGFRQCGEAQIFISVGENGACSSSFKEDSSLGRCVVSSRAHDKAGNVSKWENAVFYIDFMPPVLSKIDAPEVLFPGQEYDFKTTVVDRGNIDGCNLFINEKSTGVSPAISSSPCGGGISCVISSLLALKVPGDYTAFFACIDGAGNTTRGKEARFRVFQNRAPIVSSCRVIPTKGNLDTIFSFSFEAEDPDGDVIFAQWNFGDGIFSTQITPNHEYSLFGTYMPKVTVSDATGESVFCNTAWVVIEE